MFRSQVIHGSDETDICLDSTCVPNIRDVLLMRRQLNESDERTNMLGIVITLSPHLDVIS